VFNINWAELIAHLETQQGDARTYGVDFYQNKDGRFDEVIELWKSAGYDRSGTVEWINFYPGKHFDQEIVNNYANTLNIKCIRAWVSKINPGRYAPYHWDIDDNEEEHLKQGDLVRYTTHICEPDLGHIFIVDKQIMFNQPVGATHQWNSYKDWHAGGNCGFTPKYLFNFLGVK
jgi:hypothetical protein